jgi:radical SAM protein with 4Fe4S-binding SPASM domain
VQPNGIVTPCVYIRTVPVGDLKTQPLAEIWNNALFEKLSDRDQYTGHCRVCEYRSYCGGCRARALAYTGDILGADPGCIENERLWERLKAEHEAEEAEGEGVAAEAQG